MSFSTNPRTQPTTQYFWGMKNRIHASCEEYLPNPSYSIFLSKIKLQYISTKNFFIYSLRLQSLNLRKASAVYTNWSSVLCESNPDHPSISLTSCWTMVLLIPSHAMQHIIYSRENSDKMPKHALEQYGQTFLPRNSLVPEAWDNYRLHKVFT